MSNKLNITQPTEEDDEQFPWDQQPGESARHYAAFLLYRDMGMKDRSLQKVADVLSPDKDNLRWYAQLSRKHDWVARCDAYDRYILATRSQRTVKAIEKAQDTLLKDLDKVTQRLADFAAGRITLTRDQLQGIKVYMDKVGLINFTAQTAPTVQNNTYNDNRTMLAPPLPEESKPNHFNAEGIKRKAEELIPEALRKKKPLTH